MSITLKEIIGLAKELPEECFEETFEKLKEIKEKAKQKKSRHLWLVCVAVQST